jgi:glucosamine kinase
MLLIADSGSTKTDWILIDNNKKKIHYKTIGYNPFFIDTEQIYLSLLQNLCTELDSSSVNNVFFYGAGCSSPQNKAVVMSAIARCFPNASVSVEHDLLGAARALLGIQRGFISIIGTGSNTCIYDGTKIEKNIDSLGYVLGDEGSGAYIGKQIIRDYLRAALPNDLSQEFFRIYSLSQTEILDSLYNKPLPNRFLAGFCKFAGEYKDHSYIKNILRSSFGDFFLNLVCKYQDYGRFNFNCVGTVGFFFKKQLSEVADSYNIKIGEIIASPIEKLVMYHMKHEPGSPKNLA